MADIIDINSAGGEEENLFLLEDENGNEVPFEFVDLMEYEGEEYLFLLPVEDDDGEVVILHVDLVDGDEEATAAWRARSCSPSFSTCSRKSTRTYTSLRIKQTADAAASAVYSASPLKGRLCYRVPTHWMRAQPVGALSAGVALRLSLIHI